MWKMCKFQKNQPASVHDFSPPPNPRSARPIYFDVWNNSLGRIRCRRVVRVAWVAPARQPYKTPKCTVVSPEVTMINNAARCKQIADKRPAVNGASLTSHLACVQLTRYRTIGSQKVSQLQYCSLAAVETRVISVNWCNIFLRKPVRVLFYCVNGWNKKLRTYITWQASQNRPRILYQTCLVLELLCLDYRQEPWFNA